KVTAHLANKPVIQHIVDFMKTLSIETIMVVVGHEKKSVMSVLAEQDIIFVEQTSPNGTADAVTVAMREIPEDVSDVLVVYGDDALLYSPKNMPTIKKFLDLHNQSANAMTLLTIDRENPSGLGRIIRDEH